MKRVLGSISALLLVSVLLGACGDDDDEASGNEPPPRPEDTAPLSGGFGGDASYERRGTTHGSSRVERADWASEPVIPGSGSLRVTSAASRDKPL